MGRNNNNDRVKGAWLANVERDTSGLESVDVKIDLDGDGREDITAHIDKNSTYAYSDNTRTISSNLRGGADPYSVDRLNELSMNSDDPMAIAQRLVDDFKARGGIIDLSGTAPSTGQTAPGEPANARTARPPHRS